LTLKASGTFCNELQAARTSKLGIGGLPVSAPATFAHKPMVNKLAALALLIINMALIQR
jgi:hypothetical protein